MSAKDGRLVIFESIIPTSLTTQKSQEAFVRDAMIYIQAYNTSESAPYDYEIRRDPNNGRNYISFFVAVPGQNNSESKGTTKKPQAKRKGKLKKPGLREI